MPFYFRKSVSAGPFRFNFSSGGIGMSVGVKGFRVGTGPRGHYVHAGRGGFYYRATYARAGARKAPETPSVETIDLNWISHDGVEMIEVESGDVLAMREVQFADLLDEINSKRQQARMSSVLGVLLGLAALPGLFLFGPAGLLLGLLGFPGFAIGNWLDSFQRTAVLFYELEPEVEVAYQRVIQGFDSLMACGGKWHIEAGGAVRDTTTWKRNAGASHLVQRKPTMLGYRLPTAVTSNLTPPALNVGKQVIYFFPDLALVDDGKQVGAVGYRSLALSWQPSNFIEEGPVPRDAQIISHTWKHPNKRGGPDRRFRDNRQLPVCRYEALHMSSSSGLNELVEFSRVGTVAPFISALSSLPTNPEAPVENMRLR